MTQPGKKKTAQPSSRQELPGNENPTHPSTKQELIQAALEAERRKFQIVAEYTPFGIALIEKDGSFSYLNPKFTEMFGYDPAEVPDLNTWREKVYPDPVYRRRVIATWEADRQTLPSKEKQERTFTARCRDGSQKVVSFRMVDLETGQQLMTFIDITARVKAEKELRLLSHTIESVSELVSITDMDDNFTFVNRAFIEKYGYTPSEVLGQHVSLLRSPNNPPEVIADLLKTARSGNWQGELQNRTKDGREFTIFLSTSKIRDNEGSIIGLVGIAQDITERKQAEEERRQLAAALRQAADGVIITALDGMIRYINPAFERICGYAQTEIAGTRNRLFEEASPLTGSPPELKEAIVRGEAWNGRFPSRRKDGTPYQLEATYSPIRDSSGHITSYVGIHRDVTNEILMENQLRQAQKMEAIGTLAGGIAHDFNNVLSAIIGYTQLSLLDIAEANPLRQNQEQVLKAAQRASELVKQILTFSRQSVLEQKPIHLSRIIREAFSLLRATLPSTIEIRLDIQAEQSVVLADPSQIHQIMMNLFTNAAQSLQEGGGLLEVGLQDVKFSESDPLPSPDIKPGSYVCLIVRDTGQGMKKEVMERIFEPFFTTKDKGRGTGLGLAVVYRIVRNHGGAITVESTPGVGSTFKVFIPRIDLPPSFEQEAGSPLLKGRGRILFVDDEENLAQLGKMMLTNLGYETVIAENGLRALDIFRSQPGHFDLVVTDQTMPQMTGLELAEDLLRLQPGLPIILCTGYSETATPERIKAVGIREFIMKPLDYRLLAETVHRLIPSEKPLH